MCVCVRACVYVCVRVCVEGMGGGAVRGVLGRRQGRV